MSTFRLKHPVSTETSSPTVASEAVLGTSLATKDCMRPYGDPPRLALVSPA